MIRKKIFDWCDFEIYFLNKNNEYQIKNDIPSEQYHWYKHANYIILEAIEYNWHNGDLYYRNNDLYSSFYHEFKGSHYIIVYQKLGKYYKYNGYAEYKNQESSFYFNEGICTQLLRDDLI